MIDGSIGKYALGDPLMVKKGAQLQKSSCCLAQALEANVPCCIYRPSIFAMELDRHLTEKSSMILFIQSKVSPEGPCFRNVCTCLNHCKREIVEHL
jgi:hypothetical protein